MGQDSQPFVGAELVDMGGWLWSRPKEFGAKDEGLYLQY